jgi:putative phage-type endonuclease
MRILSVQQGTDSWHAERARRFTASEAPAIMGASKFTSRSDLLKQKATGIAPEVTPQKQALFDRGHAAEAGAREIVEEMIGEPLFPATAVHDTDDSLLASFDGITMTEDRIMECKLWSESLAAQVRAGELEPHYYWQLEAQLLVSGADVCIFVCSDGTREKFVSMEYRPVPGRREALLAGWRQFEADLAAYVPPAASAVEKIVAEPVEALPAVSVIVEGSLVVRENFAAFQQRLMHFLEHRLIREPKSDQDFANLDAQIKEMKAAEEALQRAEAQMLAQIQSVDQAKKTKDMLAKLVRDNRLMAEKLLASEKERRKGDIVAAGVKALADHLQGLNRALGGNFMPAITTDFGGCIKGMKSLSSMEDKVATELARAKIAANDVFLAIQSNLNTLRQYEEHSPLFPDKAAIVQKKPEDLQALVTARIAEHRAAEERRLETERARIRAEEEAKLRREQEQREAEARRQQEAEARAQREAQEAAARAEQQRQQAEALRASSQQLQAAAPALPELPAAAPATNVLPMPTKAPAGPPTMKLGDVKAALAPLTIDAAGLAALGFPAAGREGAALLFHASDLGRILDAAIGHLAARRDQLQKAA